MRNPKVVFSNWSVSDNDQLLAICLLPQLVVNNLARQGSGV